MDEDLCTDLGIDSAALVRYIETNLPDYLQLETWVREHATKLDTTSVAAHNLGVATRNMREELARERRARFGIKDEHFANGIRLNDLDDWAGVHALLTASRPAKEDQAI
jgi:hypothetical protein